MAVANAQLTSDRSSVEDDGEMREYHLAHHYPDGKVGLTELASIRKLSVSILVEARQAVGSPLTR